MIAILVSVNYIFYGHAAVFICIGFGLLFLRKAAPHEVGPGFWAASCLFNSAGFLTWTSATPALAGSVFVIGGFFHMLGFLALAVGVYRFTGQTLGGKGLALLAAFVTAWFVSSGLVYGEVTGAIVLYGLLRCGLFAWVGWMILRLDPADSLVGRWLAGWGAVAWAVYATVFPPFLRGPDAIALGFGFLVGFHLLVALGLMIMIIDRMRAHAQAIEDHAQRLEGLLPICANCKRIRDEADHWQSIEGYIRARSDADFSHGICPDCARELYPEYAVSDPGHG